MQSKFNMTCVNSDGLFMCSVVIPEGLIESIPELKLLLRELDDVYKEATSNGGEVTKVSEIHEIFIP